MTTSNPWRPISSCPKDGSDFFVCDPDWVDVEGITVARWDDGRLDADSDIGSTHWAPIEAIVPK